MFDSAISSRRDSYQHTQLTIPVTLIRFSLSLSLSPSVFFSMQNFPNFSTTLSPLLLKLPHSHPAMHDLPYECNFDN
ncbi:hypothetical protein VNO80_17771 [Phaseolus coccineus]|uniref:Uncharacterized protein n=1 Tax=Phaseolus coccineus TaxID=3886 RepID=A0AAN9MD32_PHACN